MNWPLPALTCGCTALPLAGLTAVFSGSGAGAGFSVPAIASRCNTPSSGGGGSVAQPASQTTPARATSRNSGDFSVRTINELLAGSSQPARPDVSG